MGAATLGGGAGAGRQGRGGAPPPTLGLEGRRLRATRPRPFSYLRFPNLCSQSGEAAWRGRAVGPGNLEFRGPPDAGCTYDWESATRQELR